MTPAECPGGKCGPHRLDEVNPHHVEYRRRQQAVEAMRTRLKAARKRVREASRRPL